MGLPGLKTNSLQLWDLGKSKGPEGGDNEGRDLLRWLHPGTDGQLLEHSSGWLGEWKDRDGSNPDLSRLDWVDDDGHKDWAHLSWVHLDNALQGVDGDGPAGLNHGLLGGWDGSLDVLNNLDKSLESLQVTSLAQSKNGRQTNVLRLGLLNLLNKQWDELASENLGLLGSEDTEDHGWEVVPHGGWVDVSVVEQVRELEKGGSVEHLVGLDSRGLDHLDKLFHELLGWVPDVAKGKGNHLHQGWGWEGTLLDLLDNEHGGWVGSNKGQNVVEDLLHGLHASGPGLRHDLGLEVLKLREGHGPHVVGQSVQEGCHLTASVTGEGGLHNLTSNLLDTLLNLWDNLLLVQLGNDVNWSLSQMWEWEQWAHTQNLLGLLNNLLVKGLLMRKGLALNTWELIDQRLDDPGGGWDVHARGDWLGLKEGDGNHGWRDGLLLSVVASKGNISNLLVGNLADGELVKSAADVGGGGGGDLQMSAMLALRA